MFTSSIGGGVAARCLVYRHALVRFLMPALGSLPTGSGWSGFSLVLCCLLMQWSSAPTLMQRFESSLSVLDRVLPRRRRTGRTYQGFVKALLGRSASIRQLLAPRLRTLTQSAAGSRWRMGRFVPIGADGSKFDAPRTIANEALGLAGKDKCGPQMMLLLLVHLGCMIPWSSRVGRADEPERSLLRSALDDLPEDTLLVADAGFTGFDFLSELLRRKVHFLVRVGRGIHLLKQLGCYRREGKDTVYLWPSYRDGKAPLTLRLFRIGSIYLITSVIDSRELSRRAAGELYRRRWGLEVSFRALKQTLERRKVRSCQAERAKEELLWSVIALWILTLMGMRTLKRAGLDPHRLSIAGALAAIRHAAHSSASLSGLRRRMCRAVMDQYLRRAGKTAYRWPHKKNPKPPGAPRLTVATRLQVARAQALLRSIDGR